MPSIADIFREELQRNQPPAAPPAQGQQPPSTPSLPDFPDLYGQAATYTGSPNRQVSQQVRNPLAGLGSIQLSPAVQQQAAQLQTALASPQGFLPSAVSSFGLQGLFTPSQLQTLQGGSPGPGTAATALQGLQGQLSPIFSTIPAIAALLNLGNFPQGAGTVAQGQGFANPDEVSRLSALAVIRQLLGM